MFNEIKAKHDRGEKITEDERDYVESRIERRNQEESAKRQAARRSPSTSRIHRSDSTAGSRP
jgi:hypothetical protein